MIIDKRMNEIMKENLDLQGEELGDSYPTQEWFLGESSRVIWAAFPPLTGKNLQKTASKACWKCCKTHPKCQKISVFTQKFFSYKNLQIKVDILDLSMSVRN
jgi:hypothetical protein